MKQIVLQDLNRLTSQAAAAERLRANLNLHEQLSDNVQRLAIAMEPGTYIRPHRHLQTWELLTPLRGRFVVLQFDDNGKVLSRTLLGEGAQLLEMPAGTWHAVLSVDHGGVIFEVKQGPYQPLREEDTQSWAPAEGGEGIAAVLRWYAIAQVGDSYTASNLA